MAIALLGDNLDHPSHRELNALIPRLADEFGVDACWVHTSTVFDVADFDAVWLMSGSPYADEVPVYSALGRVRELRLPFLGTCSGMQYAVLEYIAMSSVCRRHMKSRTARATTTSLRRLRALCRGRSAWSHPCGGRALPAGSPDRSLAPTTAATRRPRTLSRDSNARA